MSKEFWQRKREKTILAMGGEREWERKEIKKNNPIKNQFGIGDENNKRVHKGVLKRKETEIAKAIYNKVCIGLHVHIFHFVTYTRQTQIHVIHLSDLIYQHIV